MAQDINLLPEISKEDLTKSTYQRKVNLASIGFLLVVVAILLSVFGYYLFLTARLNRITFKSNQAEEKIVSERRKEITRRALVDKLNEAQKNLSEATPYSIALESFIGIFGSGAVLTEGSWDEGKALTITGEAVTSDQFGSVVGGVSDQDFESLFTDVELVSLKKESVERPYTFNIDVKFLRKGIPGAPGVAASENED